MDAVDVALITTDGEGFIERGPSLARPYTAAERAVIAAALPDAMAAPTARHRTDKLTAAEDVVTAAHAEAIEAFLERSTFRPDVIGWHGQTVAHAPERRFTMQLGRPQDLADRFGTRVVFDLRQADVEAGGQGAPLVPAYHRALARQAGLAEPVLVINLGGVANLTYIDGDRLIAFDTGPASAMIDDAMALIGAPYDVGGRLAATGRVDETALAALMDHPYFAAPAPKSLDRDAFSAASVDHLDIADKVATLTRFSAVALGAGAALLPRSPATIVAAGGGTHNRTLMAGIEAALGRKVRSADQVGFSSDFMEAEAFAFLAVRSMRQLPITYPGTTGVAAPLAGGRIVDPV